MDVADIENKWGTPGLKKQKKHKINRKLGKDEQQKKTSEEENEGKKQ